MAHNCQKWKSRFFTCPCHKIYREEAVGLKKFQLCLKNYDFCEYVKFRAISWKFDILSTAAWLWYKNPFAHMWHIQLWLSAIHHILFLLNRFSVKYRFPFPILWLVTIRSKKTKKSKKPVSFFFFLNYSANDYFTLIENNFGFVR